MVDINVRRFFSRLFWRMPATDSLRTEEEIWKLAWRILPRQRVYAWSQALMDLGALICTSRAPRCEECPVGRLCRSRAAMKRGRHRVARKEPSWNGIPDRIHRGKVVEALCSSGGALTRGRGPEGPGLTRPPATGGDGSSVFWADSNVTA